MNSESAWERKILSQPPERVIGCIISKREDLIDEAKKYIERIRNKIYLGKKIKVLDIGTGPLSRFAIELAKIGCDVEAIDISKTTIKFAKENYEKQKDKCMGKISFSHCNANSLKFKDNSFDVVLFLGILYHIPKDEIESCVSEISRVLKPNGKCVTEFFCKNYPINFQGIIYRKIYELIKGKHPIEFVYYSYKDILKLFKKNGMQLFFREGRCYAGCMLFGHPKTIRFKFIGDAITYPIAFLFKKIKFLNEYQGNYFLIFEGKK